MVIMSESSGAKPAPGKPKYAGTERRERYRLGNDAKILVQKLGEIRSEMGAAKNITRTGIYFEVFGDYQPGMSVRVTFPYDPTQPLMNRPQHAEVVRVVEIPGSLRRGVAVKLLNLFLKP